MASVASACAAVNSRLSEFLPEDRIHHLCTQAGYRWRKRELAPEQTVWLMILQLLARVSVQGLRRVADLGVSGQAVHGARQRLPVSVLQALVADVAKLFRAQEGSIWKGHRLVLADGTWCAVPDTPVLSARYSRHRNQLGESRSYPLPVLLGLLDLGTGMICRLIALPARRGEQSGLRRALEVLQKGDLLLGDRGLASFAVLAMALARGVHCLMGLKTSLLVAQEPRSHACRRRRIGPGDWVVSWWADRRGQAMTRWQWLHLPRELQLRQIQFRIQRKGYRARVEYLITTLLDAKRYPAQQIVELYQQRWQVEVYLRDLKRTLGMHQLSARKLDSLQKQLLSFVLLYNLIRGVMQQASKQQQVPAEQLSFVDALRWMLYAPLGAPLPLLVVNPRRLRSTEPRMVKRGRRRYPQLKGPRQQLRRERCRVTSLS